LYRSSENGLPFSEGSGASAGASTVEDDRRVKLYLDVTTYLAGAPLPPSFIVPTKYTLRHVLFFLPMQSGLSFPLSSLQSIASIAPLYDNVCGVYLERLPVWPLLSDAWGIIDPLLSSCPGAVDVADLNEYFIIWHVCMYVCICVLLRFVGSLGSAMSTSSSEEERL
jgi:hypothetical protein